MRIESFNGRTRYFQELFLKYQESYEQLLCELEPQIVRTEYSKGGYMPGGFYSYSRLDLVIGNYGRGRIVKKAPREADKHFRYGFDSDNRLIFTEKISSLGNGNVICEREFHIHTESGVIQLRYNVDPRFGTQLTGIYFAEMKDKKPSSFESARFLSGNCVEIDWEFFGYSDEGLLCTIEMGKRFSENTINNTLQNSASLFAGTRMGEFLLDNKISDIVSNGHRYHLLRDVAGCFSKYASEKTMFGEIKNSGYVYTISGSSGYHYDGVDKPCPVRSKKKTAKTTKDLPEYLYEKVLAVMESWDDAEIYAISFFVCANTSTESVDGAMVPEFSISYNTEGDCENVAANNEERWNYAFWRQDETSIIPSEDDEAATILLKWYKRQGIMAEELGVEASGTMYDSDMRYIGKGPRGYYELLMVVSDVAKRLQIEGFISKHFGQIPIIVHDLEYAWYVEEATRNANPNGEADLFLSVLQNGFCDS